MFKLTATAVFVFSFMLFPIEGAMALCSSYPNPLSNGTIADGSQVMANFACAALTSGATLDGATFTGTTNFPGSTRVSTAGFVGVGMAPINPVDVTWNQNGSSQLAVLNNSAGVGAAAYFAGRNGTSELDVGQAGTGNTFGGLFNANGAFIRSFGGPLTIWTDNGGGVLRFGVNGSEVGRFGTDGSFLMGTTTNGGWSGAAKVELKNAGHALSAYDTGTSGAAVLARVDNINAWFSDFYYVGSHVGSITTNGSSTSFNTTSDERLKDWHVAQRDYRPAIKAIWVGDFRWIANKKPGFGILAQQTNELFPQAITKPVNSHGIWQADYSKLSPLALWGVKDLYKITDGQTVSIAGLVGQMKALSSEVAGLHHANDDQAAEISHLKSQIAQLQHSRTARVARN